MRFFDHDCAAKISYWNLFPRTFSVCAVQPDRESQLQSRFKKHEEKEVEGTDNPATLKIFLKREIQRC